VSLPPDAGPVIVQIGELAVTSSVVHTPAGDIPLPGSTWQVADYWHTEQKIPRWAIVMSIVTFCVLTVFSLLFLLARETVHRGTVQVTVTNGTRQYVARLAVTDQAQVAEVHRQVNYVRSLAAL
jgi:type VI protein secretion system component VasK